MRYEAEISLRFVGDVAECKEYIGRARVVLGEVWNRDIILGEVEQAWRTVQLDDRATVTVYATKYILPIVTITVNSDIPKVPEPKPNTLRLRWEPEGILLTPTTLEEPGGWGLPSRSGEVTGIKLASYTAGGSLPQMLLNRYQNNKYHDKPQLLVGLPDSFGGIYPEEYIPPRTREEWDTGYLDTELARHIVALRSKQSVSYSEPDEEELNGDYIFAEDEYKVGAAADVGGTLIFVTPQTEIVEPVTEEWHAHRPEELLYDTPIHEHIFQQTNLVRVGAGEEVIHRSLRGEANIGEGATSILASSDAALFAHSYYDWTPGMRTTVGRAHRAVGVSVYGFYANNTNENLQFYEALPPDVATAEEIATYIVDGWVSSPPHYANMVSSGWTEAETYPMHPWVPMGTKGAEMHIAGADNILLEQTWVDGGTRYGYEIEPLSEPVFGTAWSQVFLARETWLPVYGESKTYDYGVAGLFGGANPYGRDYYSSVRKFGLDASVYELPEGNEIPAFDAFDDTVEEIDDFQTCLGCAPFNKDGRIYLRGVYWKSSEQLDDVALGEGYGELVVVIWPEGLGDSPILPWREVDTPEEYTVEHRQRFTEVDGWVTECEGSAKFNKAGTEFILELEQAGEDIIYEGIRRWDRVNNITESPADIDDIKQPFFDDYGLFNIQRVPMLYDTTTVPDLITFEPLLDDRLPIEAQVTTGFADGNNSSFFYEVVINGSYDIWPHFRDNAEGIEVVEFVTLHIDEHWYQYDTGTFYPDNNFDPLDPIITENTSCWGYRVHKMEFPSGKEITYMQQYMVHNFAVEFNPELPFPGFHIFPGTGKNFYGVIHYLDVENEHVIYSTHGTVTYNKIKNTDPLGTWIPDAAGAGTNYSWTRGDSYYYLDAFTDTARVEETITQYPGISDDPPRWQKMTGHNAYGRTMDVIYGTDLYCPGHTPYTVPALISYGFGDVYAYNAQQMIPCGVWSDVSYMGQTGEDPTTREYGQDSFFDSMPTENYSVTVSTRQSTRGEDSNTAIRFPTGASYHGNRLSAPYHNVAPMFSRDAEVRAKFVAYDGRWVARLEVRHVNRHGLKAPADQPRNTFGDYGFGDFLMNTPYDGVENPEYLESLIGTREESGLFGPEGLKTAVHLKANFDIDAAVGISDVYDIEPFGRMG